MITWPYIAGLFDGEGHLRAMESPCVSIAQSSKNDGRYLLEEVAKFLSSKGIKATIYKAVAKSGRPFFTLRISILADMERFLSNTIPFLIVKRTKAQDFLRYRKLYPPTKIRSAIMSRRKRMPSEPFASKLTREKVAEIFSLRTSSRFQRDIAKQYGISQQTVSAIWHRKNWR